jgi:hypothetical protein
MNYTLYIPPDNARVAETIDGYACGHGALAAAAGITVAKAMTRLKPDWVNIPQMIKAVYAVTGKAPKVIPGWPPCLAGAVTRKLVMIQWTGPWCDAGRPPQARCQYRHWIAVRQNRVWDVNLPHWVTRENWEKQIPEILMPEHGTGWEAFRTLIFTSPHE